MVWLFSQFDLPVIISKQFKLEMCVQGCLSLAQMTDECTVPRYKSE